VREVIKNCALLSIPYFVVQNLLKLLEIREKAGGRRQKEKCLVQFRCGIAYHASRKGRKKK
jgi:hypothetical protein